MKPLNSIERPKQPQIRYLIPTLFFLHKSTEKSVLRRENVCTALLSRENGCLMVSILPIRGNFIKNTPLLSKISIEKILSFSARFLLFLCILECFRSCFGPGKHVSEAIFCLAALRGNVKHCTPKLYSAFQSHLFVLRGA